MLRHSVQRVFVLFCVLVFVLAILSWCPETWHIYIVYNILTLNISSIYNIIFEAKQETKARKLKREKLKLERENAKQN